MPEQKKKTRAPRIASAVVLVIVIGYFLFRMMWGLMMLGYVDSAIARMRSVSTAEAQFARTYPDRGYTCSFSQLPSNDETVRRLVGWLAQPPA